MRKITPKKYAVSLYQSLKGADKDKVSGLIKSFVELLARNKDLSKAEKIIRSFRDYYCQQENILEVTVVTSQALNDSTRHSITSRLSEALKKEIELKEEVDQNLIGGIILKYDDFVADGSAKKQLELLTKSLK